MHMSVQLSVNLLCKSLAKASTGYVRFDVYVL